MTPATMPLEKIRFHRRFSKKGLLILNLFCLLFVAGLYFLVFSPLIPKIHCPAIPLLQGFILMSLGVIDGLLIYLFTQASPFRVTPQGITWGDRWQRQLKLPWEEILKVYSSPKRPSLLILEVAHRKILGAIPVQRLGISLSLNYPVEFKQAILAFAPEDNPLRQFFDPPDANKAIQEKRD